MTPLAVLVSALLFGAATTASAQVPTEQQQDTAMAGQQDTAAVGQPDLQGQQPGMQGQQPGMQGQQPAQQPGQPVPSQAPQPDLQDPNAPTLQPDTGAEPLDAQGAEQEQRDMPIQKDM